MAAAKRNTEYAVRNTLLLIAKRPEPGTVKTRLCPPLTPKQAADLALAFLDDTVRVAACAAFATHAAVGIGFAPATAQTWLTARFPGLWLLPQGDGDLGERMDRLCRSAFAAGAEQVVLLGADVPGLPPERIAQAFQALNADPAVVVLGPAHDGGYYLLGLGAPCPDIFRDVAWSAPTVLRETLKRAERAGRRTTLLALERDVDTPDDLAWLVANRQRLDPDSATARVLASLS